MRALRFTLLPFLLLACSEQMPVEPVQVEPAFDWMNNPDNGNFKVYREGSNWLACFTDPANGLRACHATVPLNNGNEPDCGLQQVEAPVSYQDVGFFVGYNAESWLHAVAKGDAWITIRDTNTPGDCSGDLLVVEGWGRTSYNDNDYFGTGDGANANTYRYRGRAQFGDLTYNGHWQTVCWPGFGCAVTSVEINLH